jgi:hypothetical protein
VDYVNLIVSEVPETFNQLVLAGLVKHGIVIGMVLAIAVVVHYACMRFAKATKPKYDHDDNVPYVLSYVGAVCGWIAAAIVIPMNVFYLVELLAAPRAYFMSYFF